MQINFIGHGLDITNENTVGNILATSFEKGKKFNCFTAFVAFASISGVRKIVSSINKNRDSFQNITFYIGIDENGTSKEALQCLIENKIETYIFHTSSAMIFHPKVYLFEGEHWKRVIIGSTNLTNSGLFINVEAAVSMDFRNTDAQGKKIVRQIKEYFKTLLEKTDKNIQRLTSELLATLNLQGLVIEEINSKTILNKTSQGELEIFPDRDKLDINSIDLGNAELPDELINNRNYDLQFNSNDAEKFPYFFEKWQQYKLNNPHLAGLVHRETEDRALYSWYKKIRYLISKQKEIPLQFMQQLEASDFPFENGVFVRHRIKWNERFEELIAYMKKHNMAYAHVPQHKSNTHPYHSLGQWCAQQKQRRKGNQTPPWTEYEEQKMASINFKWEMPFLGAAQADDDLWLDNYFKLEDFKKTHGHANPSQMHKNIEIKKLGKWVNDQRTLKNTGRTNKKGITRFLSPERDALLTELGVDWQYQLTKRKEELEKFIREYLIFIKIYPDGKPQKGDRRFVWVMQKKNEIKHRYKDENLEDSKWRRDRLRQAGINFW